MVCRVIDTNKNNFNSISDKNDSTPITIRRGLDWASAFTNARFLFFFFFLIFFKP